MTSPFQEVASPGLSVKDLAAGSNDAPTVLQNFAQTRGEPYEFDLTAAPGSVSLIGESYHITQLRVVIAQISRDLRESSDWSTAQYRTLELQSQILTGTVEYMKMQETILKVRQEQIDVLQIENMALHVRLSGGMCRY